MLIVIFLLLVLISISGCYLVIKFIDDYLEFAGLTMCLITGVLFIVAVVAFIFNIVDVSKAGTYDKKISLYEKENSNIEKELDEIVKNYIEYEGTTYEKFKSESVITLVNTFPELKADKLVKSQMETHTENYKKIVELKEKQIDVGVSKWWLYFGG